MIRSLPILHHTISGGTRTFPLFLWACFLAPLFAGAHGTEFITARMKVLPDQSSIELRLGIDYLGNPMIADEAAARNALTQALHIQHAGKTSLFSALAPLSLESSNTWEDTLPDSLLPPDDGQPHQIMIGTWRWQADAESIAFTVAKGNRNDVLLWQQPTQGQLQSTLLLGGDVSPALQIPRSGSLPYWPYLGTGTFLGLVAWLRWRRTWS